MDMDSGDGLLNLSHKENPVYKILKCSCPKLPVNKTPSCETGACAACNS